MQLVNTTNTRNLCQKQWNKTEKQKKNRKTETERLHVSASHGDPNAVDPTPRLAHVLRMSDRKIATNHRSRPSNSSGSRSTMVDGPGPVLHGTPQFWHRFYLFRVICQIIYYLIWEQRHSYKSWFLSLKDQMGFTNISINVLKSLYSFLSPIKINYLSQNWGSLNIIQNIRKIKTKY